MEEKIKSLLENSGMLTHLKVIECLKEKDGWEVVVSPYYYDGLADSVREIDIVAEKQFNSADRPGHSIAQVNVQLFIECKYINQSTLLWFDRPDKNKAIEALEKATDLRLAVEAPGGDILPDPFHYLQANKVAKLFSTNSGKEDLIYKALSQSLRALVYYTQWASGPVKLPFNEHPEAISYIARYPIVVCDNFSNLKELTSDSRTHVYSTNDLTDRFLLETNYVYSNKAKTTTINDYFWVDFVDIDKLWSFLQIIESEARAILNAKSFIADIQRTRR